MRVESELAWGEGAPLQSVVLTVRRGGATGPIRSERTTALGRGAGRSVLPMHVGVLETSDDRDTPLWLEARGCAGPNGCSADEAAVVQRAVVRFVPESRVLVTLMLASACVGGGRCGVEELCVPTTGRCRPAEEATTVVGTGAWPDAGRGVEDRVNVLDAGRTDDAGAHAEVLIFDAASAHDAPEEADHAELTDTGTDAEIPEELIFFDVGFPLDAAGSVDREVMVDAQRDASVSNDLLLPDGGVANDASGDRDDGSLTVDVGLPGEDCGSTPCGQHCSQGFGDCDQDPGNGCEVDLLWSSEHCGTCGNTCMLPNATAACVMGGCSVIACTAGRGDCDRNAATGCETDLTADINNCGACGVRGVERCDGMDNDCDGAVDEGCPLDLGGLDVYDFVSPSYGSTSGTAYELACPSGTVVTGFNSYLYSSTSYPVGLQLRCGRPRLVEDRSTTPYRYTVVLDDAGTTAYQGLQSGVARSIACPANAFAYIVTGRYSSYHYQLGFSCATWTLDGAPTTGWRFTRAPVGSALVLGLASGTAYSYTGPLEGQSGSAMRALFGTFISRYFYRNAARFTAPFAVVRP